MISDLSVFPNFQIGDYVGGISEKNIDDFEKLKKFIGSICIICLTNEILIIRKIIKSKDNLILLCPTNNKFEAEVVAINDIQAIANIIWKRSIFKRGSNND